MEFPTPDEIINNTYKPKPALEAKAAAVAKPADAAKEVPVDETLKVFVPKDTELSDDQKKALSIIMSSITSGLSILVIGIKPTFGDKDDQTMPTGSDFFTALHGDKETFMAAGSHLQRVIERLYTRKGIV